MRRPYPYPLRAILDLPFEVGRVVPNPSELGTLVRGLMR